MTGQDETGEAPTRRVSPLLQAAGAVHGFFGRRGGVSAAPYDSLNTGPGSGDDPAAVAENRARCAAALGLSADRLVTLRQVHSARVVVVDGPWGAAAPAAADALVTTTPGLGLGALAADCMPVLFIEPEAGVAAAAHAGWRGALAGVLGATVEAMAGLGAKPDRIRAAVGPCLRRENFEVGADLVEGFLTRFPESERFFADAPADGKWFFDLAAFGRWRLGAAGVSQIDDVGGCTLGAPADYFSHRAARRAGLDDYGRNLSAIALP